VRLKQHYLITKIFFGAEHREVHEWLDEFFEKYHASHRDFLHWKERHHHRAIEEKYESSIKRDVAVLHVLCDWFWHNRILAVPKDEDEVVLWLKDCGLI